MSNIRPGDTVFTRGGSPVLVKARDQHSGRLEVEADPAAVREAARHGYLNGLTPETRQDLYKILDEVKEDGDPARRVEALRTKVAELETDPRNQQLTAYLRAEMAHIMNTHSLKPREYGVHESRVR